MHEQLELGEPVIMKTRFITLICAASILGVSANSALALEDNSSAAMVADAIAVRPVCLVATAVGSVFWVAALPFTIPSKSVKKTGRVLVEKPARATFTRPLGEMQMLQE